MAEWTEHPFQAECREHGTQTELMLRRKRYPGGRPVLLVHGASARGKTFMIPGPDFDGNARCLADWLHGRGWEPWVLEWRGSAEIVDRDWKRGDLQEHLACYDFDHAAMVDIPQALEEIYDLRDREEEERVGIRAVGHCLGAGVLAQAIAAGSIHEAVRPSHVVLLTLGLFYQPALDGVLKSQDHVLERLLLGGSPVPAIDPRPVGCVPPGPRPEEPWPAELEEIYRNWPGALQPHRGPQAGPVLEMCDRVSFMYGAPYLEKQLVPEIHSSIATLSFDRGTRQPRVGERVAGRRSGAGGVLCELRVDTGSWGSGNAAGKLVVADPDAGFQNSEGLAVAGHDFAHVQATLSTAAPELPLQFGAIPLPMYAHGAQNARRGCAGRFGSGNADRNLVGPEPLRRFDELARVTLITGARNQLWHREGVDRMHEWLLRGRRPPSTRVKWVVPGYAHQDLLWGRSSREDVFERILDGLRSRPAAAATGTQPAVPRPAPKSTGPSYGYAAPAEPGGEGPAEEKRSAPSTPDYDSE